MAEYSFSERVKRKIHNLADVHDEYCVLSDNKLYYTHPTYEVSSLSEFVDIVSRVNSAIKNPLYDKTIIYRGHSSKEYLPVPGLSRLKNSDTDTENVIINDFITLRPDEFSNLTYLFKNRFNTTESLIEIEPDLLNKEFFSVIIKGKNKKSILKELSLVGIDADFIYPELEYTAKKIKNYYSY